FNLDGKNGPQEIPPAYGLQDVHSITVTGDGQDIEYWNRYVAVTQMGGHGSFSEPRTGVSVTNGTDDLVSSKLPALQPYQLSIPPPPPPAGRSARGGAAGGKQLLGVPGAPCQRGPEFTDATTGLHPVSASGGEPEPSGVPSYASRGATKMSGRAPLRGVGQPPPYFH